MSELTLTPFVLMDEKAAAEFTKRVAALKSAAN